MFKNKKIVVVMPAYNAAKTLQRTYGVVNDGSTNAATVRMLDCAWPKTRVIHTDNQGLAAARNNGIREAAGQYILPLDADDKIEPDYLENAVRNTGSVS